MTRKSRLSHEVDLRSPFAAGIKKTAAQRNMNIAAEPDHSQNPRCQKTEFRRTLRMGIAHAGFNRARTNKHSLRKIPASGSSVSKDQVQNKRAWSRFFLKPFHAHQQALNMPIAMNPAAERAMNSCRRRIPNTSCTCCGTTRHAQMSATIPTMKASALTWAARGEAISKLRRNYPANGSISPAATMIPQAGNQKCSGLSRGESRFEITR